MNIIYLGKSVVIDLQKSNMQQHLQQQTLRVQAGYVQVFILYIS